MKGEGLSRNGILLILLSRLLLGKNFITGTSKHLRLGGHMCSRSQNVAMCATHTEQV